MPCDEPIACGMSKRSSPRVRKPTPRQVIAGGGPHPADPDDDRVVDPGLS